MAIKHKHDHPYELEWPSSLKKTKTRESVLTELREATKPLSALDLYTSLLNKKVSIAQSTVYRTLETLVEHELVLKDSMLDAGLVVYELNRNTHTHYAICLACHKVIALDICPIEKSLEQVTVPDFAIQGHKVEIYGYCHNCSTRGV